MPPRLAPILIFGFLGGCASSPVHTTISHSVAADTAPKKSPIIPAESMPLRAPKEDASCPLFFPPHPVGSVVIIPAHTMAHVMNPVMHALCSCTNRGEYTTIVARIFFENGTAEVKAPENASINECLEKVPVTFEPIPEGETPSSDCINCGPRYYGVFVDSPPPPKKTGMQLMYSFGLDRSNEVLDCPNGTHAERGECRSDVIVAPAKPAAKSCECLPTDLKCAITCAASK